MADAQPLNHDEDIERDLLFNRLIDAETWRNYFKIEMDRLVTVADRADFGGLLLLFVSACTVGVFGGAESGRICSFLLVVAAGCLHLWVVVYKPREKASNARHGLQQWADLSGELEALWVAHEADATLLVSGQRERTLQRYEHMSQASGMTPFHPPSKKLAGKQTANYRSVNVSAEGSE